MSKTEVNKNPNSSYLSSGVNIDEADSFVSLLSKKAQSTFSKNVINGLGGFAGLFRLPSGYNKPVLVACTDGVGSKLKIAYENNNFEGIGQDLVAMCVNDLLCCGAQPLFFLDYLACAQLKKEDASSITDSIIEACKSNNISLLGGETAELPGMLPDNGYELAGFSVGIVDEDSILNPDNCKAGDVLIGLPSSGLHSNGYSLVRKVIKDKQLELFKNYKQFGKRLLDELLVPTTIYCNAVSGLTKNIKAIAHITGGGLIENLPRAFGKNLKAEIKKNSWAVNPIFSFLQEHGEIDEAEMFRVFNMGIGLVLIVSPEQKENVISDLKSKEQVFYEIGVLKNQDDPEAIKVNLI